MNTDALTVDDYEEVLADHRRLVRELDVLLNGEGAAENPSLCDIIDQIRDLKAQRDAAMADCASLMRLGGQVLRSSIVTEVNGVEAPSHQRFFPVRVQMLREISEGETVEIKDGASETVVIGASAALRGRLLDWWNHLRQNPRPLIFEDKP